MGSFASSEAPPAGGRSTIQSTQNVFASQRREFWQDVICKTYFPLDIAFAGGGDFKGGIGAWADRKSVV